MVKSMPKDKGLDHTLKILSEGYPYILNRRNTLQSNVFETRLLVERVICLTGKEAAELFYSNDKFRRSDAAPPRVKKTLFGEGGVQGLDGDAHHHRKGMFMSMMSKESLQEIVELTDVAWDKFTTKWEKMDSVKLYEESKKLLTLVACHWTGVPVKDRGVKELSQELGDMFESAASVGVAHYKSRRSRSNIEKWLIELVEKVRNEEIQVESHKALYAFSTYRDLEGNLLDSKVVAVELLNLLRPIVAISVYITFTALALHHYPKEGEKLKEGDSSLQLFIQEVRRYYPFFPFTAARVNQDFEWKGYSFKEGTLTLLDLYGTNHHPEEWENPDRFSPSRFADWTGNPFDFIPQGGGEFDIGHRCAGEWITIDILKVSLKHMVHHMTYTVPDQDLDYSYSDIPSLPKSGFMMKNVRHVQ
ncbi:cytochrome P450 [Bacillus coahuilensis]|uniref:cytochrome P450 n=1 Tax=Bacillus coahuilensis TaxID=408580 RepID=UPI00018512ED|nr:cytochrome P450 [Bacillus coahuilensis]